MNRILAIEDDPDIQDILREFLQHAGYEVAIAEDGVEGLHLFHSQSFHLILLDLMLPKIDGFGVCELIRKESSIPIIMLTALDGEEDQIKGFDLKIDDYVTKPFNVNVLIRKIEAILRRTMGETNDHLLTYRDITLDNDNYSVIRDGLTIELTQREFEILRELLNHQGKIMTRKMLLNNLWKYDFFGDERVVDTHIKNLRKKLVGDYIVTIRGVGYRIDKEIKK